MQQKTLSQLADRMRGIDIAMLSTKTADGRISSRPMSNNGDVDYDGDSYFFTRSGTRLVQEIEGDRQVSLSFSVEPGLLAGAGLFVAVEAIAEVIRDRQRFAEHWVPDLDAWFEQGIDTPDLVLLKVHAVRIRFWDGADQGELTVAP
jgi:general stress protein 26